MIKHFLAISLVSCPALLFAQSSGIKGRIMDGSTGETLPFANVFIDQTTIGTTSDQYGEFELKNIPTGVHELVIAYVGYQPLLASLTMGNEIIDVGDIGLTAEEEKEKKEVIKIRDPNWERQYKKFVKVFLGEDEWAESCEILNAYALSFARESGGALVAYASEPIEISNMALGYKLSYLLQDFRSDNKETHFEGKIRFSEIITKGGATALRWMENRKKAYTGSSQHLFKSILDNRIHSEGFYLYTNSNKELPSHFYPQLGTTILQYDTTNMVSKGTQVNTYRITLNGKVEVHNHGELVKAKVYNDEPYSVSWIETKDGYVEVNEDGSVLHSTSLVITGDMRAEQLSHQIPYDYKTERIVTIKKELRDIRIDQLQEKIYVQTDKPYYYPGEMMWMKAFVNYRYPELRDSMSKTLYVELINPRRKIVTSAMFQIENGSAKGNWIVTDTLSAGNYYLRAYTNLNRNFSDDKLFIKPVPILGITEKVDESEAYQEDEKAGRLKITADKSSYGMREKITLNFKITGTEGVGRSNLSLSVTDAHQVVPVKESKTIVADFPFHEDPPKERIQEVKYPVEYGISILGQYLNRRQKPDKTTLSILQGNFEHLSVIETDPDGMFQESGLQFYDTAEFHFQIRDNKRGADGTVRIIEKKPPALDFKFPEYDLKTVETNKRQRLITEYEVPRGARLLQEVMIKGLKEKQEAIRPYGNPDYVVKAEDLDISTNNLFIILQGKVPGMVIRTVSDSTGVHHIVRIARASGLTILGPTEPMVMVDNVPLSGRAGDILQSINAYTVDRIEVITRVSPAYGSQGANGVISIYLKKGISVDYTPPENVLQVAKIRGYSRPDVFRSPDYEENRSEHSQPDYRSIIYWNPEIVTDEEGVAKVSFYTADLQTRYRVVVEGVTENNEPVRGVHYLNVVRND